MNRRDFLQAGLGAAALAAGTLPSGGADAAAGRTRIPIGVLGASYSHAADKIRLTQSSTDWELVGVADDSTEGRRIAERLGAPVISREELFRRAQVVAVESEVRDHARHALLALEAGKHVHLEKPPATRLTDMQAVVERARVGGRLLQTGFMWRYHPGFEAIFEAVRQGWLGEVYLVRGFISNHVAPEHRPAWAEFAGGALFELGSHLVDAVVRLLGRPREVRTVLRRHGRHEDTLKDNNLAVLEYDHALAVLVNTALQPVGSPARAFEVLGTRGSALLQPIEPPRLVMDLTAAAGPYRAGRQTVPMPEYRRYVGEFAELAAAVRGERPLRVGLDEELLVAELVLRAGDML